MEQEANSQNGCGCGCGCGVLLGLLVMGLTLLAVAFALLVLPVLRERGYTGSFDSALEDIKDRTTRCWQEFFRRTNQAVENAGEAAGEAAREVGEAAAPVMEKAARSLTPTADDAPMIAEPLLESPPPSPRRQPPPRPRAQPTEVLLPEALPGANEGNVIPRVIED